VKGTIDAANSGETIFVVKGRQTLGTADAAGK
jgi:hypothetical protein